MLNRFEQILKDTIQCSNEYLSHLIFELKRELYWVQPGNPTSFGGTMYNSPSHAAYRAFFGIFAIETLSHTPNIFTDLKINIAEAQAILNSKKSVYWDSYLDNEKDTLAKVGTTLYKRIVKKIDQCLSDNISLLNLFERSSDHALKTGLESFAQYCTKYYDSPNVENVLKKITAFTGLKKILDHPFALHTPSALSTLKRYKQALNKENGLDDNRHLGWDRFFAGISVILLPIALCRIGYNLMVNGTWHFMWSDGKKFKEKINAMLPTDKQLEQKIHPVKKSV